MSAAVFDAVAAKLATGLGAAPRLVVIGSTSFWGADSRELCRALAVEVADIPDLVVVTGGMDGVGETFADTFERARRARGLSEALVHLLPLGFGGRANGITLAAGHDLDERREILGRVGHVYLVVEGGPGTRHEADVAVARGWPVLPVGRTGGQSAGIYAAMTPPEWALPTDWALLGDPTAPHPSVAGAVKRMVVAAFVRRAK